MKPDFKTLSRIAYRESILGRMMAEGATSLSDSEIERTLAPCVAGSMLVRLAKELRNAGLITLSDIEAEPDPKMLYESGEKYL